AGSLLEFTLAKHSFSMPVGRIEYLYMHPVTFLEYLTACNEKPLIDMLQYVILTFIIKVNKSKMSEMGGYFLTNVYFLFTKKMSFRPYF
ncbi:MAG TPA: hypothetical protein VMW95_08335, partial [Desulfobacterales bacterium]|nr:hypothetical protein [Desulfobacterales bacterium]